MIEQEHLWSGKGAEFLWALDKAKISEEHLKVSCCEYWIVCSRAMESE